MRTTITSSPTHLRQGQRAEVMAKDYLLARGLRMLTHNYHCRYGEMDLIMQHGSQLVFIEVRYRRSLTHGGALHSVQHPKQQRLRRTAKHYLQRHAKTPPPPCRFDVIAIGPRLDEQHLQWIQNAF